MENNKIDQALKNFLEKTKKKALGDSIPEMQQEITQNVINSFAPVIQQLADQAKISKDDLASVLKEIQIVAPEAKIPEIHIPEFNIPTPQVTVNVPKQDPPHVTVSPSEVQFPDSMKITGFDNKNPIPVQLVDLKGRPYESVGGGSIGGGFPMRTLDEANNAIKVTGSLSTSPFATYYASDAVGSMNIVQSITLETLQVSGATDSVNVVSTVGLTDTQLRASTLDVKQVSGSSDSVAVLSMPAVVVTSITNSIATSILNGDGVALDPRNRNWTITETVPISSANTIDVKQVSGASDSVNVLTMPAIVVTSITNTIAAANVDSTGVQYSGSNPVPVYSANTFDVRQFSGAIDSVFVSGAADSFFAYEARTTNPTAKSDGADVRPKADKLGRALTRPIQVRDLTKTAYVSVSNGTETTLLAATAGAFNDLIMITATNNSTAATQLDIRCTTAGNIIHTMLLPASTGPVGFSPSVPWPQDATGNNWTIDMPDQTGTTVYVSALFSQEI